MINHNYIYNLLEETKNATKEDVRDILDRANNKEDLSHRDIAILLQSEDENDLKEIFKIARKIKNEIYGKRIVIFAPLYLSDYCANNCVYCGYKRENNFKRRKLTRQEIQEEVKLLEKMGHKRLAIEAGEDPINCDIEYILEAIEAIYETYNDNGKIRRVNVNIAATTVDNYRKLKDAGIGTYILFQETYHKPTYEKMHPNGPKANYDYHLTAFNRAIEGGIDDVGAGVLFGLYDYKFEVLALMLHNEYLEKKYGVGFHTISVPRLKKAEGMELSLFPHIVTDDEFKKIVAIIRLAVPFTGIILSTRETYEMRKEVIEYGVSQISAGSCTGVGGYKENEDRKSKSQFEVADNRKPFEVIKELIDSGHIPSYCTACYRMGRTGDRFMQLAKSGQIQNVCGPNALMTLMEYALDYGNKDFQDVINQMIDREIVNIEREDIKNLLQEKIDRIKQGERDLYL
ncbi:[FeFe] hydrogenase H-cluster radical SAM maturase HydG [Alkaliphilus sp. MSJ-5]|uniref:[FeFe] hydrogenase H-cluster radical SAM maturase HydG n=1 Tax=Alkaliphilus flagellatus TaxID=2841507 RepID=A0ABS6FZ00_9FIRM|nr:[FeFe] hydrogenase H-cluster radical SAM maturase HydG [Alkaliphilus flagellatus]MBU5675475.1 [FeFe] hydrogenase H-cluster radical SAM maturase HydG [Alkaliphilus flagellatus]